MGHGFTFGGQESVVCVWYSGVQNTEKTAKEALWQHQVPIISALLSRSRNSLYSCFLIVHLPSNIVGTKLHNQHFDLPVMPILCSLHKHFWELLVQLAAVWHHLLQWCTSSGGSGLIDSVWVWSALSHSPGGERTREESPGRREPAGEPDVGEPGNKSFHRWISTRVVYQARPSLTLQKSGEKV